MEDNIIIDYEELFNENEEKVIPPNDEEQKNNSVYTLVLYVILFILGGASLLVAPFFSQKESNYLLLEQATILENPQHIYFVEKDYINTQDDFIIDDIYIFSNSDYDYLTFANLENSEWVSNNLTEILAGEVIYWPKTNENDEDVLIIIYVSEDLTLDISNNNSYMIKSSYSVYQEGVLIFLSYLIVVIPLVYLNRKKIKFDYSVLNLNVEKPFLANLLSSLLLMYAISIGLGMVSTIFAELFGMSSVSSNQESIDLMLRSKSAILVILTVTFIGPLVEELVFRSAIFSLIKNSKRAIIVSSVVFGLIHITTELFVLLGSFSWFAFGQMLVFSIPYIGMGVFLSYLYHKNNHNIILLYGVHALYNLIVSILGLLI